MSNSEGNKGKMMTGIIIALLLFVAILGYKNIQLSKEVDTYTQSLDESKQLEEELNLRYDEAVAELEEMKGSNTELNGLIDAQKEELAKQKKKISSLIRSGKANKSELSKAREELTQLRGLVDTYVSQINTLKNENMSLTENNNMLQTLKAELETNLTDATTKNESLNTEKAVLMSEKQELEATKKDLSYKVTKASVIKLNAMEVTGYKTRSNGKLAKKRYAKNVDIIEVCFKTSKNEIVKPGNEEYFVRLISPQGVTMAMENMGSGIIINNDNNEEVRYTASIAQEYANDVKDVCLKWKPNAILDPGSYKVEVFNKGFLAGKSDLILK